MPEPPLPPPVFVYGHTRSSLYELDPRDASLVHVGDFDCISLSSDSADSQDGMTDLAIDRDGNMFGVGRGAPGEGSHVLSRVEPLTGECTIIGSVMLEGSPTPVQGLSFVPEGTLSPDREVMVGTSEEGDLFRIDPATAVATRLGTIVINEGLQGGDPVSVIGASTWVISSTDVLVTFDVETGEVLTERPIVGAPRGDSLGWGLGYWGGSLYAFSYEGHLYRIDTETAEVTEIPLRGAPTGLSFRGAAVTTAAPHTPLI